MKYLIYTAFLLLCYSCSNENPIDEKEEEEVVVLCENDPFQMTIELNGITMSADSCWLVFIEDPNTVNIDSNRAVLKWEYPGYPEWNGANSLSFEYLTDNIETGVDYQAQEVIGVVEFNGTDGEMMQGLGNQSLTVSVKEYDDQSNYICGSFKGQVLFTDYSIVDVEGSFKGVLNP